MGLRTNIYEVDYDDIADGDLIRVYDLSHGRLAWTDMDELPFMATEPTIAELTDSITLTTSYTGKVIVIEKATATAVTVPATLPAGFNCAVAQWGAGAVTFTAGSGATNRTGLTAIPDQYGMASVVVLRNSDGSSAEYIMGGDIE
jgi:hypothetical protein